MLGKNLLKVAALSAPVLLATVHPANALTMSIDVQTEIVQMSLTGTGPMPLGKASENPGLPQQDGYAFIESDVVVTESALYTSSGTTSVSFEYTPSLLDPLGSSISSVTLHSIFDFYLDITISKHPGSPGMYGGNLHPDGDTVTITNGGTPLSIEYMADVSFAAGPGTLDLNALLALLLQAETTGTLPDDFLNGLIIDSATEQITSTPVTVVLRDQGGAKVDVGGGASNDSLTYGFTNFVLDVDSFEITDVVAPGIDEIILAIFTGDPLLTLISAQVGIANAALTFTGSVQDLTTDPPFSIELTGPINEPFLVAVNGVPEPGSLALLGIALAGLSFARRGMAS